MRLVGRMIMIVCSCNAISDTEVSSIISETLQRLPAVSEVYTSLGHRAQCGRCAPTIKKLPDAVKKLRTKLSPSD
jgi:bacterioferritin-associated ferredoxin